MPSIQKYTPSGGTAYIFSSTGRPHYSVSSTYEAAGSSGHGLPRRKIVRHRLVQWFKEPSFADNQARYAALKTALANAEGVLYLEDEGGSVRVNARVRVLAHDLPEQWGQHMAEVRVEFESIEELSGPAQTGATFTPDAGSAVSLGDVRDWVEKINTVRFSEHVANRRESRLTVTARGSIRANPADAIATRRAYLQAQAALLRGLNAKDGVLAFGSGFSERVRVVESTPALGDATDEITWSLTAEMLRFPSGSFVEADWKVMQADDDATSERTTRVAGTIRAHDEAAALAKRDAILLTWTAAGRLLKGSDWNASLLDGADGATDTRTWEFALSFRENTGVRSYAMKVSTREDKTSGLIVTTYAGSVTASSSSAALTKARALGKDKLDMKLSEEEDISSISYADSADYFTQVTFSYTYESRGAELHAEVTSDVQRDRFGANVQTVSGWAVGANAAAALAFARTFKVGSVLVQSEREGDAEDYHAAAQLFKRITFTYAYRLAAIDGSIEYSVSTSDDFSSRETITTYKGVARGTSAEAANALIDTLLTGFTGRWVVNERDSKFLASGGQSVFDCRTFTVGMAAALSNGEDILEAEVTIITTPSIQKAVFTEIPFGVPHLQSDVGRTIGTIVATGSVTAVSAATARAWARTWIPSGYTTNAPSEAVKTKFLPRSGTVIACTTVQFTYSISGDSVAFV